MISHGGDNEAKVSYLLKFEKYLLSENLMTVLYIGDTNSTL